MSLIHQSVSRVMKRSVLLIAAGVALFTTSAFAEEKVYRLTLAETWGPNFPIFGDTTKNMAAMAEKMSNGRLQIRIDSANKHKAPLGVFDMVKSGQYDMGHSASYYWKGKVPNTLYFTSMPFWYDDGRAIRMVLPRWWYGTHGEGLLSTQYALIPRW